MAINGQAQPPKLSLCRYHEGKSDPERGKCFKHAALCQRPRINLLGSEVGRKLTDGLLRFRIFPAA